MQSRVSRPVAALLFLVMFASTLCACASANENEDNAMDEKIILRYPVFDGERIWEGATVVIENGMISDETILSDGSGESGYLLMPGLIDAHTHMGKEKQVNAMLKNGITTTCDVSVSEDLKEASDKLYIHTSFFMALGNISDGRAYVENAMNHGAEYIKMILEEPARMASKTMDKAVLRDIVTTAHENDLKVAVHAVTVSMVQMAADAGVDILIHVPMEGIIPRVLAEQIARQGISVVPTLVMMEAFSKSLLFGYKRADYANAEKNVQLLHALHVPILVGTDANNAFFVPKIEHGISLHEEMELLVKAGLSPLDVLQGATSKAASAFGIESAGRIAPGNRATLVLVEGRPDETISDSRNIRQVWIDSKPIL